MKQEQQIREIENITHLRYWYGNGIKDSVQYFQIPCCGKASVEFFAMLIRADKVRLLVYIADAAVVGESPNVKSKVELKSKILRFCFTDFVCVSRMKC